MYTTYLFLSRWRPRRKGDVRHGVICSKASKSHRKYAFFSVLHTPLSHSNTELCRSYLNAAQQDKYGLFQGQREVQFLMWPIGGGTTADFFEIVDVVRMRCKLFLSLSLFKLLYSYCLILVL